MQEIEMTVVEASSLPEKFRPAENTTEETLRLPPPLADLIEEATSGLTDAERGAFLSRLREDEAEVLASANGEEASREEWRERLIARLKEEANRFMAAAASL